MHKALKLERDKARETKTKFEANMSGGRSMVEKERTKSGIILNYPHRHHHHVILIHGIGPGAWC